MPNKNFVYLNDVEKSVNTLFNTMQADIKRAELEVDHKNEKIDELTATVKRRDKTISQLIEKVKKYRKITRNDLIVENDELREDVKMFKQDSLKFEQDAADEKLLNDELTEKCECLKFNFDYIEGQYAKCAALNYELDVKLSNANSENDKLTKKCADIESQYVKCATANYDLDLKLTNANSEIRKLKNIINNI